MKLTTQGAFLGLAVALVVYQAAVSVGAALFADDSDRWFFVIILATFILKEKLTTRRMIAVGLAFIGAILVGQT